MVKRKIEYSLTDGVEPKIDETGGALKVRSPLQFELGAEQKLKLDMGVSFSCPTMIVAHPSLARQGIYLEQPTSFVFSGESIVLRLSSFPASEKALFERGDCLAYAFPLGIEKIELNRKG